MNHCKLVILCCVTFILMFENGIMKSFGVLLPILREQFATQTWVVGLAISLTPGIGSFLCLPLLILRRSGLFDPGYIIILVGFVMGLGLFLASFCRNAVGFAVTMILQSSVVLAKVTALSLLPIYFTDDTIDMANSIASCGMSFGMMIMPPITQFILDLYGWRSTLWILGALSFHCLICGCLILNSETQLIKLPKVCTNVCTNTSKTVCSSCSSNITELGKRHSINHSKTLETETNSAGLSFGNCLNIELLRSISFLNILLLAFSFGWVQTCWLIYLVPHAETKGIEPSLAALLGTLGGVGNIVGKLSYVICKRTFSGFKILLISCALCGISLGIDPLLITFTTMGASSILYALTLGTSWIASLGIIKDIIDADRLVDAFAWFYIVFGVSSMIAAFTTGTTLKNGRFWDEFA